MVLSAQDLPAEGAVVEHASASSTAGWRGRCGRRRGHCVAGLFTMRELEVFRGSAGG